MKNTYIYIDESGDTGYTKKSTRYFILTAVMVDDPFVLRRVIKNVYKIKVDKSKGSILHAHGESNKVKSRLLNHIRGVDIQSVVFTLDKTRVYKKDPYRYLLEKTAKYFSNQSVRQIVLARRETRFNYNQKIIEMFNFYNLDLVFSTQQNEKSLQLADFYSWAVFVYMEYNQSDYFIQLKNRILFR